MSSLALLAPEPAFYMAPSRWHDPSHGYPVEVIKLMGACRGCRRELHSERGRKWEGALRTLSLFGIVHDMSGAHVPRLSACRTPFLIGTDVLTTSRP